MDTGQSVLQVRAHAQGSIGPRLPTNDGYRWVAEAHRERMQGWAAPALAKL